MKRIFISLFSIILTLLMVCTFNEVKGQNIREYEVTALELLEAKDAFVIASGDTLRSSTQLTITDTTIVTLAYLDSIVNELEVGVNIPDTFYSEYDSKWLYSGDTIKYPSGTVHDPVTIGTPANGLSLSTQQLNLGLSGTSSTGALSSTDWNTFNNKQSTLTTGTLTENVAGLQFSATRNVIGGAAVLSLSSGYIIPTTAQETNWNTAYTDRLKWDGGATGLNAATGRTSLGGTTLGQSVFTSTKTPDFAFLMASIDNSVTWLDAAAFRGEISAEEEITAGLNNQYWRGDKTWQTLNTNAVEEGTNLYFTNARSRSAISLTTTGSSGAATYSSSTGVFNIPNYTLVGLGFVDGDYAHLAGTETFTGSKSFSLGINSNIIQRSGTNYLRAESAYTVLSSPSASGTIYFRPNGDAISTGQVTIGTNGQMTSTATTGTAPFSIASTTVNTNLNADLLDGKHSTSFMEQYANLDAVDLNDYKQSGSYRVNSNCTNIPTVTYYTMVVFGNESNVTTQLASNYVTGETYIRSFNTVWSAWRKVWDSVNFDPTDYALLSDLDALGFDGTGTQNYLTKFGASGASIINSQIIDNGSRVVIGGSDNGTDKLQVGGNIYASGNNFVGNTTAILRNSTADDSNTGYSAIVGGGSLTTIQGSYIIAYGNENTTLGGGIRLQAGSTTGTEEIQLRGGNVIIGSTTYNTTDDLQVTGSGYFTGAITIASDVYDSGWNGLQEAAPKDAIYDKIESIPTLSDGDKGDITVSNSGATWNIDAGTVGVTELNENTTATTGALLVAGASNLMANEQQLYWDATNHRLGIYDNQPTHNLEVNGSGAFADSLRLYSELLDSDGDAGTSGQVLSSTGTATNWIDPPTGTATGVNSYTIDLTNGEGNQIGVGGSLVSKLAVVTDISIVFYDTSNSLLGYYKGLLVGSVNGGTEEYTLTGIADGKPSGVSIVAAQNVSNPSVLITNNHGSTINLVLKYTYANN